MEFDKLLFVVNMKFFFRIYHSVQRQYVLIITTQKPSSLGHKISMIWVL